jgi:hypothetical protein
MFLSISLSCLYAYISIRLYFLHVILPLFHSVSFPSLYPASIPFRPISFALSCLFSITSPFLHFICLFSIPSPFLRLILRLFYYITFLSFNSASFPFRRLSFALSCPFSISSPFLRFILPYSLFFSVPLFSLYLCSLFHPVLFLISTYSPLLWPTLLIASSIIVKSFPSSIPPSPTPPPPEG